MPREFASLLGIGTTAIVFVFYLSSDDIGNPSYGISPKITEGEYFQYGIIGVSLAIGIGELIGVKSDNWKTIYEKE